jgi:hypothetical protein
MFLRPVPELPPEIAAAYRESSTLVTLLDVGANGTPPPMWRPLAPHAHYVGVGPGSQPLAPDWVGKFAKAQFDDRILTTTDTPSTTFYATTNPIYSSVLRPQPAAAVDFLEPRLTIDQVVVLPAVTLDALVSQCALDSIDWIHVNVNGTDVPLIQSLRDEMFRRVLAIDTYLNVTDLWVDDASGIARLPELIAAGFWLSRLHGYGPLRFRRDTLAKLHAIDPRIHESLLSAHVRTPGWMFVRLFRTVDWLNRNAFSPREYLLLWTFALMDDQLGFAADVMCHYESRFKADSIFLAMRDVTIDRILALKQPTP